MRRFAILGLFTVAFLYVGSVLSFAAKSTRNTKRKTPLFPDVQATLQNIFTYEGEDTIKAGYSLDLNKGNKVQMHIEEQECGEGVLDHSHVKNLSIFL